MLRKQIAWEYIYSYPLPVLAHTVASLSGNGTAVNTFYSKSNHLSVPADNSLTPNHDTIYSQAELDLSQVIIISLQATYMYFCIHQYTVHVSKMPNQAIHSATAQMVVCRLLLNNMQASCIHRFYKS